MVARVVAPVIVLALAGVVGAQVVASRAERSDAARQAQAQQAAVQVVSPQSGPFVVNADARGHFNLPATINGRVVQVVVDTGASMVALPFEEAARLGIRPGAHEFRHPVSTANGTVQTAQVFLGEVRIGPYMIQNVRAVVMPAGVLDKTLLGMTVLSRFGRIEIENGRRLIVRG